MSIFNIRRFGKAGAGEAVSICYETSSKQGYEQHFAIRRLFKLARGGYRAELQMTAKPGDEIQVLVAKEGIHPARFVKLIKFNRRPPMLLIQWLEGKKEQRIPIASVAGKI
jgi:hypothetical protein